MSINFLRGLVALLSIFTLACGAMAYWLWNQPVPVPADRPITVWEPPPLAEIVVAPNVSAATVFPETFARPIFLPTRRPYVAPPEENLPPEIDAALLTLPQAAAPDVSLLVLKGIRLNEGNQQALVLSATSPAAQWLSLGSEIEGFRLVEIGDDRVTLEAGQQRVEIKLYENKADKLPFRQ